MRSEERKNQVLVAVRTLSKNLKQALNSAEFEENKVTVNASGATNSKTVLVVYRERHRNAGDNAKIN